MFVPFVFSLFFISGFSASCRSHLLYRMIFEIVEIA